MPVALVRDDRVGQIFPSREAIAGKYHADFIAGLIDVPDQVQLDWVLHEGQWLSERPAPQPTAEDFANAIQAHIDETAKARGYGDGYGLASYVASKVVSWAAEAQAFVAWRDAVWMYAYNELAKVQGGQRPVPTIGQMISELPTINWP